MRSCPYLSHAPCIPTGIPTWGRSQLSKCIFRTKQCTRSGRTVDATVDAQWTQQCTPIFIAQRKVILRDPYYISLAAAAAPGTSFISPIKIGVHCCVHCACTVRPLCVHCSAHCAYTGRGCTAEISIHCCVRGASTVRPVCVHCSAHRAYTGTARLMSVSSVSCFAAKGAFSVQSAKGSLNDKLFSRSGILPKRHIIELQVSEPVPLIELQVTGRGAGHWNLFRWG